MKTSTTPPHSMRAQGNCGSCYHMGHSRQHHLQPPARLGRVEQCRVKSVAAYAASKQPRHKTVAWGRACACSKPCTLARRRCWRRAPQHAALSRRVGTAAWQWRLLWAAALAAPSLWDRHLANMLSRTHTPCPPALLQQDLVLPGLGKCSSQGIGSGKQQHQHK